MTTKVSQHGWARDNIPRTGWGCGGGFSHVLVKEGLMQHKLTRVLSVNGFVFQCVFNEGEVRFCDLTRLFELDRKWHFYRKHPSFLTTQVYATPEGHLGFKNDWLLRVSGSTLYHMGSVPLPVEYNEVPRRSLYEQTTRT